MKKYNVLALLVIFIGGMVAFTSCDQTINTNFEEGFQKVKQVTPIEGAQDVTMDLSANSGDSFFSVTINGKEFDGWCIEWSEDASFGINEGTKLYSTKGQEAWRELNYFMHIKNNLRANDPDLTYREIQVVIWSLIDNPSFDVDKISEYENISERIYSNGQPQFDLQKVKNIVSDVKLQVASASTFKLSTLPGLVLYENNGQTIMSGNETAYAYGNDYATCFLNISNLPANNWGWTNGPLSEGKYEFPIYAGAGQCNLNAGTLVGRLLIDYSDGTATISYEMTETSAFTNELYTLLETHLFVSDDDLLPKNGPKYTSAPGQFGNVDENHDNITEFTYTIKNLTGNIWVAAHSVVSGFEPPESL